MRMCPMIKQGDPPVSLDLLRRAREELPRDYGVEVTSSGERTILLARVPRAKPDPQTDLEVLSFGVDEHDAGAAMDVFLVGDAHVTRVNPVTLRDVVRDRQGEDREVHVHLRKRLEPDYDLTVFRHVSNPDHLRVGVRIPRPRVADVTPDDVRSLRRSLAPLLNSPKAGEVRAFHVVADDDAERLSPAALRRVLASVPDDVGSLPQDEAQAAAETPADAGSDASFPVPAPAFSRQAEVAEPRPAAQPSPNGAGAPSLPPADGAAAEGAFASLLSAPEVRGEADEPQSAPEGEPTEEMEAPEPASPGSNDGAELLPSRREDPGPGSSPEPATDPTPDDAAPDPVRNGHQGPRSLPDAARAARRRLQGAGYETLAGVPAGDDLVLDLAAHRPDGPKLLVHTVEHVDADVVRALATLVEVLEADAFLCLAVSVAPGAREAAWGTPVVLHPASRANELLP